MPGKTYGWAENIEETALGLIPNYHPELATARIKYIYVDKASQKAGRPVFGKVRKVSGALQFLLDLDFLVEVALDLWNEMDGKRRNALVDHLLERCYGEEDEKTGEMHYRVREPDVQEFASILQRHGAWNDDLNGFVSVAQSIKVDDLVQNVVASVAEEIIAES